MKNRIVLAIILFVFGFAISQAQLKPDTLSPRLTVVQSATSDDPLPPPPPPPPPLP